MRMNESTGRKMGPRETRLRTAWAHADCSTECRSIRQAMLTDALEEALGYWGSAGISGLHYADYDRLRAVLAEVDRG